MADSWHGVAPLDEVRAIYLPNGKRIEVLRLRQASKVTKTGEIDLDADGAAVLRGELDDGVLFVLASSVVGVEI